MPFASKFQAGVAGGYPPDAVYYRHCVSFEDPSEGVGATPPPRFSDELPLKGFFCKAGS